MCIIFLFDFSQVSLLSNSIENIHFIAVAVLPEAVAAIFINWSKYAIFPSINFSFCFDPCFWFDFSVVALASTRAHIFRIKKKIYETNSLLISRHAMILLFAVLGCAASIFHPLISSSLAKNSFECKIHMK